ncbi:MAG: endonuclease V [Caldilinea sp. CFX5]|nr:endonuclease V [Caldilinea sp. CFX5]
MKCCLDVDYRDDHALAAALLFADWGDAAPTHELTARIDQVEPYIPGQFYHRELPCLLAVLAKAPTPVDLIVIDGYVWLDSAQKPGLGAHLYTALGEKIPVIGVAKKPFHSAAAEEVYRAGSDKPLYVTAVGMTPADAAAAIAQMHGLYRIPTLLKRVDQLCRQSVLP